jgi:O-antigen/teichoic acid export membrane protein
MNLIVRRMITALNNIKIKRSFSSLLIKNFSWTLLGSVIYSACQWGILVILAKLGSADMIGLYTLGLAVTAPIILFFNLQLREVQATDSKREYQFGDYLGLRIISNILSIIVIVITILLFDYSSYESLIIFIVGLSKIVESFSDLFYGVFQQNEVMDSIAKSKVIRGVTSVIIIAIIIYLTNDIFWALFGLLISWLLVLMGYDIFNCYKILVRGKGNVSGTTLLEKLKVLRPNFSIYKQKNLILLALPLGIVGVLDTINLNFSRYFIESYQGLTELGYFSSILYLMMLGGTIMSALGQAFTARLSYYYVKKMSNFVQNLWLLILFSLGIGVLCVIAALLFGKEILSLIYTPEYAKYSSVFIWIMVAALFWYVAHAIWCGITAARKFKVQTPLFLIVVLSTCVSCFFLVPEFGLIGAAWSVCIGMLIRLLGSTLIIFQIITKR